MESTMPNQRAVTPPVPAIERISGGRLIGRDSDMIQPINPPAERRETQGRRTTDRNTASPVLTVDAESLKNIVFSAFQEFDLAGAHRSNDPVRTLATATPQTLLEFYESAGGPKDQREKSIADGFGSAGTLAKEKAAVSFWAKHSGDPQLSEIDQDVVRSFIGTALNVGSRGYVKGLSNQIRGVLNRARDAGQISLVPSFSLPKAKTETASEFRGTPIYEVNGDILQTLADMFQHLQTQKHAAELCLALICGASFGPRTIDLLTLRREQCDLASERPVLRYRATKTGTPHVIPLADWLVARIRKHDSGELLFPNLMAHGSKDPARSRACRATKAIFRDAAIAAGFDWLGIKSAGKRKPFQVLRATCNERYERHSARAGEWILGHGMSGVNRASYQNPGLEIYEAANSLPQPPCFTEV